MSTPENNPTSAHLAQAIDFLRDRFADRATVSPALRNQHSRGEGLGASWPPDIVVFPISSEEVSLTLECCNRLGVPVIAYGAGTSVEGHVTAPRGGVCLDLSRMDAVLAVHTEDGDCVVQPGVTREALNAHLKGSGLFFPVDPGANATLGGMASTGASGTTTMRYGSMTHNVMALEVALADGRRVRFGTRARKSSAGYDLVHLLIGAEGTLGVITELTLRLHPLPDAIAAATCAFPTLRHAIAAVTELTMTGLPFARIEFLDEHQIRACNAHSKLGLTELPTLFLEFHGSESAVKEQSELAQQVTASHAGTDFSYATQPEDRTRLWRARHLAYFAALALRPGSSNIVADVCVPVSALPECVERARSQIEEEALVAPILGHVGDGNFHVIFLLDLKSDTEQAAVTRVYDAMVSHALQLGGTCTGEHGIGLGKKAKLLEQCGADVVELMRGIKRQWDPNGILNPDKIFD
jgi:D-lactate dehydrogenase (cytochrome)